MKIPKTAKYALMLLGLVAATAAAWWWHYSPGFRVLSVNANLRMATVRFRGRRYTINRSEGGRVIESGRFRLRVLGGGLLGNNIGVVLERGDEVLGNRTIELD